MTAPVTAAEFRAAMASFASGVMLVTTVDENGVPFGLTATAFISVSVTPPTCLVSVSTAAEAHPVLLRTRKFAANVLRRGQEALSTRFSISGADKFDGTLWTPGEKTGCPILPDVIAVVECDVQEVHRASDHDLFLGLVVNSTVTDGPPPRLFPRSLRLDRIVAALARALRPSAPFTRSAQALAGVNRRSAPCSETTM